jgi:HK97 family phage prohead protease
VAAEIADWDGSYTESWQRGAFAKTIREGIGRIPVLVRHNRYDPSALVGRTRALTEDSVGLFCELMLGRSPEARRALEDVEDGLQDGLSIGFMPIRDKWNEKHTAVIREEARLREISLTPWPVYQETGAKVAHREESPELDRMRQVAAAMRERRPWEV